MHILAIIFSVLMGAIIWWWRLRTMRDMASTALDIGQTAANLPRKMRFKRKARADEIDRLDDARLGALVYACWLLSRQGVIAEGAITKLEIAARGNLGMELREIEENIAYSRWLAGSVETPNAALRVVKKIQSLAPESQEALRDLVAALGDDLDEDGHELAQAQIAQVFRLP